ncbi:MAG: carbamoyltransferase HypF, partial [Bacteroidota bacterium]
MTSWGIHIEGRVQGVGFRPFVYRLAREYQLCGQVSNGPDGVRIIVNASQAAVEAFTQQLQSQPPPVAIITQITCVEVDHVAYPNFSIVESPLSGTPKLLLTPDLAMCSSCREELSSENRRKSYAFTTCTNCGPRYSISKTLPYDRPRTTMDKFEMCPACLKEYHDPTNRRHFSQTNSCPDCAVELTVVGDAEQYTSAEILEKTVSAWRKGEIVAIKGIGGFLLTCDARQPNAISRLRELKHRPDKPLALMMRTNEVATFFTTRPAEERLLAGIEAPIVLLAPKKGINLPLTQIAPGLDRVGVMLPYTPLFQLLLAAFSGPIIATSGNVSGEPIVYEDEKAMEKLGRVADVIVGNNRSILLPQDDSVQAVDQRGTSVFLRRSRGYAPVYLPGIKQLASENLLAFGADLKATFGIQQHGNTYLSQYLGDLNSYTSQFHYQRSLTHLRTLLQARPKTILADLHPNYVSTQLAYELGAADGIEVQQIQHHEAHFAAVLLENDLLHSPQDVLGVIWDGTGFGTDGQMWGGECFRFSEGEMRRVSQLNYFPHFAGDKLAKEPRLSAIAIAGDLPEAEALLTEKCTPPEWKIFGQLRRRASLSSSSMGRLFDAVSSLLGLCDTQSYEGMAASLLMTAARKAWNTYGDLGAYDISLDAKGQLPTTAIMQAVLADTDTVGVRALRFHLTLVDLVRQVADQQQIGAIAFSGGVLQNILLV